MTIDLTTGSAMIQLLPPLFKDDSITEIEINPTDLDRQITLKLVDQTSSQLIAFMSYKLDENQATAPFAATINLTKVAQNHLESFKVIVCWSYSNYSNLIDLCNESTQHEVVNALGSCLTEFEVFIPGAKYLYWPLNLNEPPVTLTVVELLKITQVRYNSPELVCGEVAFMLLDES